MQRVGQETQVGSVGVVHKKKHPSPVTHPGDLPDGEQIAQIVR
jgi:hypothetical protein